MGFSINGEAEPGNFLKTNGLDDGDCKVDPNSNWASYTFQIVEAEVTPRFFTDRILIDDDGELKGVRIQTQKGAEEKWDTDMWFCDADYCTVPDNHEYAMHAPYVYLNEYEENKFRPFLIIPRILLRGIGYFTPIGNSRRQTINFLDKKRSSGFELDFDYYANRRTYRDNDYNGKFFVEVSIPVKHIDCQKIIDDPKRRTTVRSRVIDNPTKKKK